MMTQQRVLVDETVNILMTADSRDDKRPHVKQRFELPDGPDTALRLSVKVRTQSMPGVPGKACAVFFNIEYASGPVFWDTFCYPDTGTTPWRWMTCDVMARGPVRCAELHVSLQGTGTIEVSHVRVEAIELPADDDHFHIAVFGDSTDMTCYLPHDLRLTRKLELLLRDRFSDELIKVHNMAEGGDYLGRFLESGRLERELSALKRCDLAMVRYGLNDAPRKVEPAVFATQLETVCQIIGKRFPDATIVLSTTIPALGDPYAQPTIETGKKLGLQVIPINEMMRTRSAAGDCDWHNSPTSMIGMRRDKTPADDPTGLKGDLHPNAHGSQMIAECYAQHLEPVLAKLLKKL